MSISTHSAGSLLPDLKRYRSRFKEEHPWTASWAGDGSVSIRTALNICIWAFRLVGIPVKMKPRRRLGNWSLERAGRCERGMEGRLLYDEPDEFWLSSFFCDCTLLGS
ncbi:hypothetical protein FIBSPDRAFT_69720 [Athelia psychrophila]|uniref:Uncharacterized protein n=1 Tax=Athelia psychrophila TaxID=1759441 RepID=A0A166TSZ9_9AGAM|nr:hypothetical protein FIBSPDRAFT_69720 [Fibularhizoctonia sp. CBS 109695]